MVDFASPQFPSAVTPTLPSLGLDESEKQTIALLRQQYSRTSADMALCDQYYRGAQTIKNLRIAVPKELESQLRTLVGWAAMAVDPYVERLNVDAFRKIDATDGDEYLMAMMAANGFESEQSLYNPRLKRRYEIRDDIPVMLIDEATTVDDAEHDRLLAKAEAEGVPSTLA